LKNKSQIFIWSLFDFANSSYSTIIVAFVYAVYFKKVIAGGEPSGDLYWAIGINISMIISAVLNPVCGAIADHSQNKKKFLLFFTILCIIPTAFMYFTEKGDVLFGIILFIISNIGFQTGLTFYDAFISEITEEKFYNKVSGIGYAVGYAGSLISVLLVFPLQNDLKWLFVITSGFFMLFSTPLFLYLKEKKTDRQKLNVSLTKYGISKVLDTLRNINKFPDLKWFLLAFFLYIDAVETTIFFSGNYASSTLNFSIVDLTIFFLIVQITALGGSLLFGSLGDRIGIKRSIFINLFFWILIVLSVFFTNGKTAFYIIGGFAGTFLGSTQALSRTLMTILTPKEIKTQLFGFYALLDKTSTLLGPLTFGLVSYITGNQKIALLSVGLFFILGMLPLVKVKEK
jgi:UMF1 family MFS transporter